MNIEKRARALTNGSYYKLAYLLARLDGYDDVDAAQLATIREADALDWLDGDAEDQEAGR